MTQSELRSLIDDQPMRPFQIAAIALCCVINMLDGFDILAIAFTGARIKAELGFDESTQGFVYGAGPLGMAVGAFLLAPLADIIGRRNQVLVSLVAISFGMATTFFITNSAQLIVLRLFTGIGIGSLIASLNTIVAEYSSVKRRNFSISIMHLGYGVGAGFGGLLTIYLLGAFSGFEASAWRYIFLVGGLCTAAMIPLVLLLLPESIDFLLARKPNGAIEKVNRVLERLGEAPLTVLPESNATKPTQEGSVSALSYNIRQLFAARELARSTLSLWVIAFCFSMVLYFLLSWSTQVLIDQGLEEAYAIYAAALFALSGAVGGLALGYFADRFGLQKVTLAFVTTGSIMLPVFGLAELWGPAAGISSATMTPLMLVLISITGFFVVSFFTGYMATAAQLYPTAIRNTGLGMTVGVGRIGSAVGPVYAGLLLGAGWERPALFLAFTLPLVIALIAYARIRGLAK